jgi:hypothetical protein
VFDSANPAYDELMTATYNVTGVNGVATPAYLSRITVGALADFGYTVSYAGAESYTAPAAAATQTTAAVPATAASPTTSFVVTTEQNLEIFGPIAGSVVREARRLPPRLTFPDRAPMILMDTDAARDLVLESLAGIGAREGGETLDLRSLSESKKAALMAWATYTQPRINPFASLTGRTSAASQPRLAPGIFGSITRVTS